jgi:hypothetical protein
MSNQTIKIKNITVDRNNSQIREYDTAYEVGMQKIQSSIGDDLTSKKFIEQKLKEINIQSPTLRNIIEKKNKPNIFVSIFSFFKHQ